MRGRPDVAPEGRDPRQRAQPDRTGLEFDYCCCHAAFALRDEGFETVMVNCNPETVSTDYDTVDRLYFEPLTFEDVSSIITREQQGGGDVACVVQYGGQTPLKLALSLQEAGIRILGTSPDSIDLAEDRERFAQLLWDLGIPQAPSGTATIASKKRATSPRRSGSRSSSARRTCSAAARWRSSTTRRRSIATWRNAVARVAGASDPDRQVPRGCVRARRRRRRGRHRRGRHRRHHGAHRGGRHPLGRQLVRRAAVPRRAAPRRARFATTRGASRARSRSSA